MESLEDAEAGERLWSFAVAFYARPGVADACLSIQDDGGGDVPALLFCLWLGLERGILVADRLAAIDHQVRRWHDEIVQPLRAVRRRLKGWPGPPSQQAAEAFRNRVKAIELEAERVELLSLAALAADWPRSGLSPSEAAGQNLDSYCRSVAATDTCAAAIGVMKTALRSAATESERPADGRSGRKKIET